LNARIVVAYVLEHFCAFRLAIAAMLFASLAISFRSGPLHPLPPNVKVKKNDNIFDVS